VQIIKFLQVNTQYPSRLIQSWSRYDQVLYGLSQTLRLMFIPK